MMVRECVLALAVFGLSGCENVTGALSEGFAQITAPVDATNRGIRTLSLLDGEARVRGPEGYCVDQRASNARRGFAVLAGCALMSDTAAVMPTLDGLITVQFGAPQTASVTGNERAFAAFLESDAGRSVLAVDGQTQSIAQVATIADRSGVLARFEDVSGPGFEGTKGPQWRGFLDIGGRLVTVSVLSFERNTLSRSEGERLLVVTMAELAEVNAPEAAAQ